jgi:capsular exopolysaccharide synthesis family protein
MTLHEILGVLRARWLLVVLGVLAGVVVAAALAWSTTPVYAAKAQLFVSTGSGGDPGATYEGGLFSQQRVLSYARIVSSPELLESVIGALGLDTTTAELAENLRAEVPVDTVLIDIEVEDTSPRQAQAIANEIVARFPAFVAALEARGDTAASPVRITATRRAELPTDPVSPRWPVYIALGVLLGLAAGLVAAFVRHALDTRVRDGGAVAEAVGAPLVGVIASDRHSRRRGLVVARDSSSAEAEAYRRLRSNLAGLASRRTINALVVSSALEGEGKTVVTANLGMAFAQAGYRVVLVDADLRRPRLAEYLGVSNAIGLADALRTDSGIDDLLQRSGDGARLELLASGVTRTNPSDLLGSQRLATVLEHLTERSDIVLVDAPAVLPVIDAAVVARRTSGLILVARAGSTRSTQLTAAADAVRASGAEVLGAVLTRVPRSTLPKYYREHVPRKGTAPGPRVPADPAGLWPPGSAP